jgi:hypothetical protein
VYALDSSCAQYDADADADVEDSAVCSTSSSMGEGEGEEERIGEVYAVAGDWRRDGPGLLSRHGIEFESASMSSSGGVTAAV